MHFFGEVLCKRVPNRVELIQTAHPPTFILQAGEAHVFPSISTVRIFFRHDLLPVPR